MRLRLVFPTGARRAERPSSRAFGVVDGLALLGMAPGCRHQQPRISWLPPGSGWPLLGKRVPNHPVALVLGANGWDLACRHGLPETALVNVGNRVGPLLAAAAEQRCRRVLLWGCHGKLRKLAGGIFHTHHHVADGHTAVLTAFAALEGLTGLALAQLHRAATVEAALNHLRHGNRTCRVGASWWKWSSRLGACVARHGEHVPEVGVVVLDGQRQARGAGPHGQRLLNALAPH